MNFNNTINVPFFINDDIGCTRKKFSTPLEVNKLVDSDNENVRDLKANECLKDGLKSKHTEDVASRRARGSSTTC